jgi:hypothetical protein
MKKYIYLLAVLIVSCAKEKKDPELPKAVSDTIEKSAGVEKPAVFSNERFRNVTVRKDADSYEISGEAQVFEAAFSWSVEDGHNELASGHAMTNAGAPEWGNFNFTVDIAEQRENSTLTLVIFESSAKDGSRQHELPVTLSD